MATLLFFIAAISGLLGTSLIIRYFKDRDKLNNHKCSVILALGLGLTMMISFFLPLLAPGVGVQIDSSLVLFGVGLSISTIIMTYAIARLLLRLKS